MGEKKAVIDNDFFEYLTNRGRLHEDTYFLRVMEELDYYPVVHQFVYEKEMMGNSIAAQLVESGKMKVIRYKDFLETPLKEQYYNAMFLDLYRNCNMREPKNHYINAMSYQESKANVGEIHSVLLALMNGYDLFLSNDNGSKTLAQVKINTAAYQLKVWNLIDVFTFVAEKESKKISKKDFDLLTKGDKTRAFDIKRIKDMWKDGGNE